MIAGNVYRSLAEINMIDLSTKFYELLCYWLNVRYINGIPVIG